MNAIDAIVDAFEIITGVFVIYLFTNEVTKMYPEYGQYGWELFGTLFIATVLFLKYGLFKRK